MDCVLCFVFCSEILLRQQISAGSKIEIHLGINTGKVEVKILNNKCFIFLTFFYHCFNQARYLLRFLAFRAIKLIETRYMKGDSFMKTSYYFRTYLTFNSDICL
jgi:hypothetical protein